MDQVGAREGDGQEQGFDGDGEWSGIDGGSRRSGAEEFSVWAMDTEEPPRLTLGRSMGDELDEHGTAHAADETVGMLFPTSAAVEGSRGEPADQVGGSSVAERQGW